MSFVLLLRKYHFHQSIVFLPYQAESRHGPLCLHPYRNGIILTPLWWILTRDWFASRYKPELYPSYLSLFKCPAYSRPFSRDGGKLRGKVLSLSSAKRSLTTPNTPVPPYSLVVQLVTIRVSCAHLDSQSGVHLGSMRNETIWGTRPIIYSRNF